MSEESKKKISDKMKIIRSISNPMTGRTGELHHNFGKHWDENVRRKMSEAHKGKPSAFKGKTHSEEKQLSVEDILCSGKYITEKV